MAEFTQGKWSICMDGTIEITDENGDFVMAINDITGAEDNDEEIDANLRLVAAAPEMYEAITECADTLEAIKSSDDCKETADLYQIEELIHSLWELLARIDGKETED